jgi:hypothetical protein
MPKSARANSTETIPTRREVPLGSPPAWIKPQLAKLVEKAPDGPDPARHGHGSISSLGIVRGLAIAAQSAIRPVMQRTD